MVVMLGFVSSAQAQTGSFEEELAQLREDVTFLQRQVYNDNNNSAGNLASSKNVSVQIGQFDELLRQVIGRMDELEFKSESEEVSAQGKVEVESKDGRFSGIGFYGNLKSEEYSFRKLESGVFEI